MFSFICCSNNEELLNKNVKKSLKMNNGDELIVLRDYPNMAKAYKEGEKKAKNKILVFVHQDVYFPARWQWNLEREIKKVERSDKNWAVMGIYGCYLEITGNQALVTCIGNVGSWDMYWSSHVKELPRRIDVLDSVVCIKKKDILEFDENVPNFHGAVEDLCYQAKAKKMGVWVINLNTRHFSHETNKEKEKIQESSYYLYKKWGLPIVCGGLVWGS